MLWRGDGVGVDVTRGLAIWEVPNSACAPTPVANKTRTTTAHTRRFMRISPLTVFGAVLSHTALNLVIHASGDLTSSYDNVGSMNSIPVGSHDSRPRTYTLPTHQHQGRHARENLMSCASWARRRPGVGAWPSRT